MLITADCGGSNGYRVRLWKLELQKLANELGITINVSHFPPGTSNWNKITDEQLNAINLEKSDFHGEWNYKIKPQNLV